MNSDNDPDDKILIVAHVAVAGGTEIYFSDNEWNNTTWDTGEGYMKYTVNATGLAAGQVVEIQLTDGVATSDGGTVEDIAAEGSLALSADGDHLYMYLGTDEANPTTFIYMVLTTGYPIAASRLSGTGLVEDVTAIGFVNSTDNIEYAGTRTGSIANIKLAISNRDINWNTSTSPYSFSTTNFSTTVASEPSNHATALAAVSPTFSEVNISWTDGADADYYLLKGSSTSYAAISNPDDGIMPANDDDLSDGSSVQVVKKGDQTASFTGLSGSTAYYFKLFPFTNYSTDVDYNTSSVPQADVTTDAEPVGLPNLVINEILADPDATNGDANLDGTVSTVDDEFVEIVNRNGSSVDIGGYTLEDGAKIRHTFSSPTVIPDGESVVIFAGGLPTGIPGIVVTADDGALGLNNGGDVVIFKDGSGNTIDSYTFGAEGGENESLARSPDYTGSFVKHLSIGTNPVRHSPGKANADGTALPVEITSFTAKTTDAGVLLSWTTATEVNNYGFEVESEVSGSWKNIGFVEGHGNSNSPKEYSFFHNSVATSYRLKQIDTDGGFEYSNVVEVNSLSKEFSLAQNYPNPFNPSTLIKYNIPKAVVVNLVVYNALGQEVATLVNQKQDIGIHEVEFNASNLPSGIYFYSINAGDFVASKKMLLIK